MVEGWYGEPYGRPLTRTREYIDIIRKILARQEPLTHEGYHYQIPRTGDGTTGLGKPLKTILHSKQDLKIVTGAISPAGVKCAAEVADGFIPVFMDPSQFHIFDQPVQDGFAAANDDKSLDKFAITPFCTVIVMDDIQQARLPVKHHLALYIGGMGARDKNFYNDYCKRLGFEDAAVEIQDHFLAGRRAEAAAAVPDDLVDAVALVGPRDHIRDRLKDWKVAAEKRHVDTILCAGLTKDSVRVLAEEVF